MAIYDYELKIINKKKESVLRKMEEYGLTIDKVVVFNQDYDFIKEARTYRVEKGTIGYISDFGINRIVNDNIHCYFAVSFYTNEHLLTLRFITTENNDTEAIIEDSEISLKELLKTPEERDEITKAIEKYETLKKVYRDKEKKFDNSFNCWKLLRVFWTVALVIAFGNLALILYGNISSFVIRIMSIMGVVIFACWVIAIFLGITDIPYSRTPDGKRQKEKVDTAIKAIEELERKSCGERTL